LCWSSIRQTFCSRKWSRRRCRLTGSNPSDCRCCCSSAERNWGCKVR
jgi:hypothetical protein